MPLDRRDVNQLREARGGHWVCRAGALTLGEEAVELGLVQPGAEMVL